MPHLFTLPRRPRFGGPLEIEIDCAEDAPLAMKLTAAVRAGADLSGLDFSYADLSGANLSGARLCGTNLYGANLSSMNLSGTNLFETDLSMANLSMANLSGASLSDANLFKANLSSTLLSGAVIRGDTITRLLSRAIRESDDYEFFAFELASGGYNIMAGCRWFSDAEFREHVADYYPDTHKAVETLRILDEFADRADKEMVL